MRKKILELIRELREKIDSIDWKSKNFYAFQEDKKKIIKEFDVLQELIEDESKEYSDSVLEENIEVLKELIQAIKNRENLK